MKRLVILVFAAAMMLFLSSIAVAGFTPSALDADQPALALTSVTLVQDSITGTVFNDRNGSMTNEHEPALEGWVIQLHTDSAAGPVVDSTTTDANGHYRMDINKGRFYLTEKVQPGWKLTTPLAKYYLIATDDAVVTGFRNKDFGNYEYGKITIDLGVDGNGNGTIDDGDTLALPPGVKAIFVTKKVPFIIRTDTLGDGVRFFTIGNLISGTYTVEQVGRPSGWLQTVGGKHTTYAFQGGVVDSVRYRDFHSVSCAGRIYNDVNINGTDDGEAGMAGWTVQLHRDTLTGTIVQTTTTDVDGNFTFNDISSGRYSVTDVAPVGWVRAPEGISGFHSFTVVSGNNITGADFGYFRGGSISGEVFSDKNGDGVRDPDEPGLTGWRIDAVNADPQYSRFALSQPGGTFTIQSLAPGSYTVSQTDKAHWTRSFPVAGSYTIMVEAARDTGGFLFGNYSPTDTLIYRTFTPDSLTVKPVPKKLTVSTWVFTLENLTGSTVDRLHVQFSQPVSAITGVTTFTDSTLVGRRAWEFSGDTVSNTGTVHFSGISPARNIRLTQWWWMSGSVRVGVKHSSQIPDSQQFFFSMPNASNVADVVFANGFAPMNPPRISGMVLGIPRPDSSKVYGWVVLKRSNDLRTSLKDKSGYHTQLPRGFSSYSGRAFTGQKTSLPPLKHNNRLAAELMTLKLNIGASAYAITPAGLGELVYEEADNPLSGKMLKEIAHCADSALTYWRRVDASLFANLDTTIRKINIAFFGPMDTVSFTTGLVVPGVCSVASVGFLRPTPPGILPRIIHSPIIAGEQSEPDQFTLYQNYPNPFNPVTTIRFDIPNPAFVTLKIYDMLGREIATLLDREQMDDGSHTVNFSANHLASGVYFYRLAVLENSNEEEEGVTPHSYISVKRMLLVK